MIKNYGTNNKKGAAPNIPYPPPPPPRAPMAKQPTADAIVGTGKTILKRFIHGGNSELAVILLTEIISNAAKEGYSFSANIPINSGESIILFAKQ